MPRTGWCASNRSFVGRNLERSRFISSAVIRSRCGARAWPSPVESSLGTDRCHWKTEWFGLRLGRKLRRPNATIGRIRDGRDVSRESRLILGIVRARLVHSRDVRARDVSRFESIICQNAFWRVSSQRTFRCEIDVCALVHVFLGIVCLCDSARHNGSSPNDGCPCAGRGAYPKSTIMWPSGSRMAAAF